MKLKLKLPIHGIVKDSLAIYPPEYFCLLNRNSAYFLRISGRQKLDTLVTSSGNTSEPDFLEKFFNQLTSHECYYGQPLILMLNNSESFSYLKILGEQRAVQVLESVRLIQDEETIFSHTIRTDSKSPIFIGQGIKKSFFSLIESLASKCNVLLLAIETLPVNLAIKMPRQYFEVPGIATFQLDSKMCFFLLWDNQGNLVFVNGESPKDIISLSDKIANLKIEFFSGLTSISSYYFGSQENEKGKEAKSQSIHRIFKSTFKDTGNIRKDFVKPKSAAPSKLIKTTFNSVKLLIIILLSMCLVGLGAVSFSAIFATGANEKTSDFQKYYSQNMKFESELKKLLKLKQEMSEQLPSILPAAEIISAFCQKQQSGVHLKQIYIDNTRTDSLRFMAKGNSKSESRVFLYHQQLKGELSPYQLSVNSLKTEIQNSRGSVDTVFVFEFGASANGIKTNQ